MEKSLKHLMIFEEFTTENMDVQYPENVVEESSNVLCKDILDDTDCDISYDPRSKMSKEEYEKLPHDEKVLICKAIQIANEK